MLCFREQWSYLFEGPQTMQAFMWQEDLIGSDIRREGRTQILGKFEISKFGECEGQTSDQPGVAGRDVT